MKAKIIYIVTLAMLMTGMGAVHTGTAGAEVYISTNLYIAAGAVIMGGATFYLVLSVGHTERASGSIFNRDSACIASADGEYMEFGKETEAGEYRFREGMYLLHRW